MMELIIFGTVALGLLVAFGVWAVRTVDEDHAKLSAAAKATTEYRARHGLDKE